MVFFLAGIPQPSVTNSSVLPVVVLRTEFPDSVSERNCTPFIFVALTSLSYLVVSFLTFPHISQTYRDTSPCPLTCRGPSTLPVGNCGFSATTHALFRFFSPTFLLWG
ncbi:hypothetical protein, unlikely [Trypanosoma brucei brucei TREU927]|uniref:Uncharacterized protein n=1 Tax=Trypanosoma brucei brucei (strain 927/4 GUTat10.1) TaxID=185431 RepID=Q8IFH8_TRYB2|nr:hypothetical protein, unlikely [Trypanosoma brucei brucei TREU927]CAD53030.1 hypothetical protein, unlikely [Trypanosoma brucei brucei TREU927]